jgi:hypothetical protein
MVSKAQPPFVGGELASSGSAFKASKRDDVPTAAQVMVEPTPREERLARIVKFHAEAAKLLATAEHATMKHHIELAICDLNEAQTWLNHKGGVESDPELLEIADFITSLGTERLIMVKKLLEMDGPGAAAPIE